MHCVGRKYKKRKEVSLKNLFYCISTKQKKMCHHCSRNISIVYGKTYKIKKMSNYRNCKIKKNMSLSKKLQSQISKDNFLIDSLGKTFFPPLLLQLFSFVYFSFILILILFYFISFYFLFFSEMVNKYKSVINRQIDVYKWFAIQFIKSVFKKSIFLSAQKKKRSILCYLLQLRVVHCCSLLLLT